MDGKAPLTCAKAVLLAPQDDVATVLEDVAHGQMLVLSAGHRFAVVEDVPRFHKVSTRDIAAGEVIKKYGQPIGYATACIAKGAHVHTHNLRSARAQGSGLKD